MPNESIFEFANKFGYESPFGDWKPVKTGGSFDPPKIVNAYIEKAEIVAKPNTKRDKSVIPITVFISVSSIPDKVEVNLLSQIQTATLSLPRETKSTIAKDNIPNANNISDRIRLYETNFSLITVPNETIEYSFTIKVYDLKEKSKVTDTANLNVTFKDDGSYNFLFTENSESVLKTIEYHTYSDGRIEKYIPKNYDNKLNKGSIKYFYHDDKNKSFFICECIFHFTEKRKNGKKILTIPNDYIRTYDYPKGGDAKKAYVYKNSDIIVEGNQEYGIVKYPLEPKSNVQLIRMPDNLKLKFSDFKIFYEFKSSQRRYCDPGTFASFIGVLAQINNEKVLCTGMCFDDATSYPSVSHPNGDSADTSYFSTLVEEQKKVDAFIHFNFKSIYRGSSKWYSKLKGTKFSKGHETHLHAGDFDDSIIKTYVK